MRIDALRLEAFGPFTDRTLDFSGGTQGLHVIFGPNEAGKSTALRALKALLYGIEERTTDGFMHGNEHLRIGGQLSLSDGRSLSFGRRKGRRNTLLSATGEKALDDDALVPFLQGVTSSVFSSLFGIDHQALVEGGEQILQQNGEVGATLFAAALGTRGFRSLLLELEEEAGNLYRPTGSKYAVNKAVTDYRDARREVKDATLAAKDWDAHINSLEEATSRLDGIQAEMGRLLNEKSVVERLQRILPRVALRWGHLTDISSMGPVVELSADFSERHRLLLSKCVAARDALATDKRKLDVLRDEASKFAPTGRVLDEGGTIHSLYRRLGAYLKAVGDRPAIEGKRQQVRNDARDILKRLRPDLTLDDIPPLRPTLMAGRRPIQELANRHQAIETAERKGRKALAEKDQEIAVLQEELRTSPDDKEVGPLKRALSDARRGGELDALLRDAARAETKLDRQCQDELNALGLWHGPLEAVRGLPLPSSDTVERYAEAFRVTEDQLRSLADERRRGTAEMVDAERTLEALRLAGAVPTELELIETRARRDHGWRLVKRAWLEREDVTEEARAYDGEHALAEAFETIKTMADDVADRLRREADRVVAHAQGVARRGQLTTAIEDVNRRESESAARHQLLELEWNDQWSSCRIVPLTPAEMRAWLVRMAKLKDHVDSLTDCRSKTQTLRETIAGHQLSLASRLADVAAAPPANDERLSPFLERADAIIASIEAVAAKRNDLRRLKQERAKTAGDLEHASSDLERWKVEWTAEMRSLGQPPDAYPVRVLSLIDGYTELFAKMDEEDTLHRRLYGIDQDISEFAKEVRTFVKGLSPEIEDADIPRTVERLNEALKRATTDKTNREALDKQVRDLALQVEETEARLKRDDEGLAVLCREAQLDQPEQLEEAGQRSQALRSLRERVTALESEIVRDGDGASLETMLKHAGEIQPDEAPARKQRVTDRIAELEDERGRLRETKGAEENELRRMTGGSAAADAALKAQEILASLRRNVEAYLRTRVAAIVLKKEIDEYRQANQDPLLVRGGRLFSSLSSGSFLTISSEIADDEPRLVGVRPDGTTVPVTGISSGARDQLYLALRLATLERYLATSEPMPFVVDDILINFDDGRALATLEALAGFSARTQVLLFTHHARISEMAASLGSRNGVFVQKLP